MTTIVPTLWIAVPAAVLVLCVAGWAFARRNRGGGAGPTGASPAAPGLQATPEDMAPAPDEVPAAGHDSTRTMDISTLEPERMILERLCARAFADAAASGVVPSGNQADAEAAAVEVLARIDAHPRYTPRRPQLLPQLTRAINDRAASAQSIAAILGQDPALAGNLLRIANSAMYRRQAAPIEHLERAVALLGTEGLRRIVMAALLQPVITDDGSVFARCAALLWEHTLLSADIATRPAQGATRDDLHAAQLLALLHGLGSVVVVQVLRDAWSKRAQGDPRPEVVVSLLDAWSVRCARSISADWGLSGRVQRALEELANGSEALETGDLSRSLRISRALAASEMAGGEAATGA